MLNQQSFRRGSSFKFQCKECGDIPEGKNKDHFQSCSCGAIAVSGGLHPKIITLYLDAYRYVYERE